MVGFLLITLPSGYWENLKDFGHPLGPNSIQDIHSFAATSPGAILSYGSLNLMRYGYSAVSLDGMWRFPLVLKCWQHYLTLSGRLFMQLHLPLDQQGGRRGDFHYAHEILGNENVSSWGLLGFALAWPLTMLVLVRRTKHPGVRYFAVAAIVFLLIQAYSSPYDQLAGPLFHHRGIICPSRYQFALPDILSSPAYTWAASCC